MHGWTVRVYAAAVPGNDRIDPIVVDVAVKYFQPVSPAREPDTVVVPRAFVQAAHGHDILSETFYPTVKCEDAVFVMHVNDSAPFAAQGGLKLHAAPGLTFAAD